MKIQHVLIKENYYSTYTILQPFKMAYKISSNHIKIAGKKDLRFSAPSQKKNETTLSSLLYPKTCFTQKLDLAATACGVAGPNTLAT